MRAAFCSILLSVACAALCGCASAPEAEVRPPAPVVSTADEVTRRVAALDTSMSMDVSCLSETQKAEYQRRIKEMMMQHVTEIGAEFAKRSATPRRISPEQSTAQAALDRCESAVPVDNDITQFCLDERRALQQAASRESVRTRILEYSALSMVGQLEKRRAIRGEFPPCDVKK